MQEDLIRLNALEVFTLWQSFSGVVVYNCFDDSHTAFPTLNLIDD